MGRTLIFVESNIFGAVRIITCIENPVVIEKALTDRDKKTTEIEAAHLPSCEVPPQAGLFD